MKRALRSIEIKINREVSIFISAIFEKKMENLLSFHSKSDYTGSYGIRGRGANETAGTQIVDFCGRLKESTVNLCFADYDFSLFH